MKFGKTLLLHQVPEWDLHYMNYKRLKKTIKLIDQFVNYQKFNADQVPDLVSAVVQQFFFELDRDVELVSGFYDVKSVEYRRRLDRIVAVLGYTDAQGVVQVSHQIELADEKDEIVTILTELQAAFRNLKWFAELNHKGFVKILKKLDKKVDYLSTLCNEQLASQGSTQTVELPSNHKEAYLTTRVEALPFANEEGLAGGLDLIGSLVAQLGLKPFEAGKNEQRQNMTDNLSKMRISPDHRGVLDGEFVKRMHHLLASNDALFGQELRNLPELKQTHRLLLSLLSRAVLNDRQPQIGELYGVLSTFSSPLVDSLDISQRTFFHQHVINVGRQSEGKPVPGELAEVSRLYDVPKGLGGLEHLLTLLPEPSRALINARDNYGRTPLHYAARHGLPDAARVLFAKLRDWNLAQRAVSIDDVSVWGDQEGHTPLHLAVFGKHVRTASVLLQGTSADLTCPNLVLSAARLDALGVLQKLIEHGISPNYTSEENHNETALYVAAKLNHLDVAEYLLEQGADPEMGDVVFGWTPIFVAAAEGYAAVVKLLVSMGARYDTVDDSGWLPMEHASLRGHLEVAELLRPADGSILLYDAEHPENNVPRVSSEASSSAPSPVLRALSDAALKLTLLVDRLPEAALRHAGSELAPHAEFTSSAGTRTRHADGADRRAGPNRNAGHVLPPIKSFGHRYLKSGHTQLLVTLGTTDLRDTAPAVDLGRLSPAQTGFSPLDTALSLVVTCKSRSRGLVIGDKVAVDLPLDAQHGGAIDPLNFDLAELAVDDVVVFFDIVSTYHYVSGSSGVLGRGSVFLASAQTPVGPGLRSLQATVTVPIMEVQTLDVLGHVRFQYVSASAFEHPNMAVTPSETYWKQLVLTRVIGHRGLGKNFGTRSSLQLGENTVELFIAAASLGASYVEFDVQLTKDLVPVVYHDFTVAETGVDIPMHTLTAEQFLGLTRHKQSRPATAGLVKNYSLDDGIFKSSRPRSVLATRMGVVVEDDLDKELRDQAASRMRLTKTWKDKGFKGNARGHSVASNFVTLEELFRKIPATAGFNIELKYPMLDEAQLEDMGEIAVDLNVYVDTILKAVYDFNTAGRDILFLSFHPDVCVLLSLKQPTIPILFLTELGTLPMADIRASSLQNAIRFAKKWNLLGIVSAAAPLVKTPQLAQVVKSSGLVCVTYGEENNSPDLVKVQMKAGVDAVIADSVLAVREGLRTASGTSLVDVL